MAVALLLPMRPSSKGFKLISSHYRCIHLYRPVTGHQSGMDVYNVGSGGNYWTASWNMGSSYTDEVYFLENKLSSWEKTNKYSGLRVRLVHNAE